MVLHILLGDEQISTLLVVKLFHELIVGSAEVFCPFNFMVLMLFWLFLIILFL
jgi:hypothetical protein